MKSIRHFGKISYKSSQLDHTSYLSSFKRKSSTESKSSKSTTEADPPNSLELVPNTERFLDIDHRFQKDKLTRHSVHFADHKRVDGSIFIGKTDLIKSRFFATPRSHVVEQKSPPTQCAYKRNSKISSNTPKEDANLSKQVSVKLNRKQ